MLLLISKNIITEAFMICNQKIVVPGPFDGKLSDIATRSAFGAESAGEF